MCSCSSPKREATGSSPLWRARCLVKFVSPGFFICLFNRIGISLVLLMPSKKTILTTIWLWQYANSYAKICQPYAESCSVILQIYKSVHLSLYINKYANLLMKNQQVLFVFWMILMILDQPVILYNAPIISFPIYSFKSVRHKKFTFGFLQFFLKISQLISERDLQRNLTSTFKTKYTSIRYVPCMRVEPLSQSRRYAKTSRQGKSDQHLWRAILSTTQDTRRRSSS